MKRRTPSRSRGGSLAGAIGTLVLLAVAGGVGYRLGQQQALPAMPSAPLPLGTWTVRFSPEGGCTELAVETINRAQRSIYVQAYSFTSAPIAQALIEAKRRGVHVEAILDKSQRTEQYSEADFLAHAGVPVSIDAAHSIAHNKVMILDDDTVITGSFNFTKAAEEHNAENLLVLHDRALAARYRANWDAHRAHAVAYTSR